MQTTIGSAQPPPLSLAREKVAIGRFTAAMEELGHRCDRAALMGSFVGPLAAFPSGVAATIPTLRNYLPPQRRPTDKQFRNLLNCEGWDPVDLRRSLVAAGFADGVEAVLVEGHETRGGPRPYDILSAHLLRGGVSIPVGWRRSALPLGADDTEPDIAAGESDSVIGLLARLQEDCEALGASLAGIPIAILGWRCGEDDRIRARVADLGLELLVEVGDEYDGLPQSAEPLGPQSTGPLLLEQMPFAEDGSAPPPRLLRTIAGRHEFVIARLLPDGTRAYAIAAPRIAAAAGSLTGARARARALELTSIAARISPSEAASRLRVADFRSADERPWEAAAYLASAFQATQMACFPRGTP